ncbi:MAG: hypothetical protein J6O56_03410 [Bacilli bacterium]|nr:hypothetical protein [Bacilli bacterium]
MKNKSSLMFLLKVILFVLIIILILLVLFLYNMIINEKNKTPKITNKKIVKEFSLKDIEYLNFDFKNYDVKYLITNGDKLIIKQTGKVNKMCIDKRKNKNKIIVKESVSNIFDKKYYKIYIPKSYVGKTSIENGFGNISVSNISDVTINNNSGNVIVKNSKTISLQNVSGFINIDGEINNISGSSSTGNIKIDKIIGSCNIETITGNIEIKNFLIQSKSKIETTSGDMLIKVDKKSDCKLKYNNKNEYNISKKKCIDGENELLLKNVTGNITIR